MVDESFFNVEFYRIILSVVIGGIISFSSVLLVEFVKNRKQKAEKKKKLYVQLISTINQMKRIEKYSLQSSLVFNYHRRYFELDENEVSKQQAEYNLTISNEYNEKLSEKAEKFESLCMEYQIYFKKDEKFDSIADDLNNWPRPDSPKYYEITNITDLNAKKSKDFESLTNFILNHWDDLLEKLEDHIKVKLL